MAAKTLLTETHPQLAAEWHPTRNDDLGVAVVGTFSNKKVWWLHEDEFGDLHEWQQIVRNRTFAHAGCPKCNKRTSGLGGFAIPADGDSLADWYPEVARWWHRTRNGDLTPHHVMPFSIRHVWWECPEGHEFIARCDQRHAYFAVCPQCRVRRGHRRPRNGTTLRDAFPDIADEVHPSKNPDIDVATLSYASNLKVWWNGACGHVWRTHVHLRTLGGSGCPTCKRAKRASQPGLKGTAKPLAEAYPNIATQWHTEKNDKTPLEVSSGSGLLYWWQCSEGHEWQQAPSHRVRRGDVPTCWACSRPTILSPRDRPTDDTGTLVERFPEVAALWHPNRNGHVTPTDVRPRAVVRVWWKCPDGHQWQATPASRVASGAGCRKCSNTTERNSRPDVKGRAGAV